MWQTALSFGGKAQAIQVRQILGSASLQLQHEVAAVAEVLSWVEQQAELDRAADAAIAAARRRRGW
jgi:hypothetical protein